MRLTRFNLKKPFVLFLAVVLSGCTAEGQQYFLKFKNVEALQQFMHWSPSRIPLVSCHRGGPVNGYPENAIETFEHSTHSQPSIIECDASLTRDSALVMMHDDKLERTTTGTGYLRDKRLSELKQLKLKDNEGRRTSFRIPTLDEVLQWGRDKVLFTLDVKRDVPYRMIIDAVRRNHAEAYSIIITYNANQAAEVHQLAPDLMISASVRSQADLERLNSMGVPNNRIVAFVGVSAPQKEVYNFLHSKGIWCILGTMGNLDNKARTRGENVYQSLIEEGADILSTDRSVECGRELLNFTHKKGLKSPYLTVISK